VLVLKAYTLADIAAVAGSHVTTSLVNAWANKGVIVPDIDGRHGRGRHRQFSFRNLLEVRVVAELHILGLPPDVLRMATAALRLFPLKLSEVYKPTLASKRDDPFAVWMRLLSPEQRKDTDQAVLI
jgi:DNA-binding transcriptional MerR regulator